ncbi:MAG: hypothetical protein HRU70_06935 [Phycisphaeraceae bacterium]|nr:MAG: hypothetical protein HRU70_06935 [Phycisphaeraceae bacterium]
MDYFTADLHLGHTKIMVYGRRVGFMTGPDRRAFEDLLASGVSPREMDWKPSAASVSRMDEALIERINATVNPGDTLWVLGDFARPRSGTSSAYRRYRDAIRCRDVRLVWGNHDNRHRASGLFERTYESAMLFVDPSGREPTRTEDELFASKAGRAVLSGSGWAGGRRRVFVSHYCHAVWHHSHRRVFHLYGHTHGNLEAWREAHMPYALAMDVGVDLWGYAPVSFADVDRVLSAKADRCPPHAIDQPMGDD